MSDSGQYVTDLRAALVANTANTQAAVKILNEQRRKARLRELRVERNAIIARLAKRSR